jgi:hypothetical protein
VAEDWLTVLGAFHTKESDGLEAGGTLALLGPREPAFWPHVTAAPEFSDGNPDPIDRWSARVISRAAETLGGRALFPFGTPVHPFFTWALRCGTCHVSPVRLLVHERAGLWVSFRGAIFLPRKLALPPAGHHPCDTCDGHPCLSACPAGALTGDGYDVPACQAFLETGAGETCLTRGCAVRRACPVGASYGRVEAQSAYHMREFHR